jgi:acyl dehydratase
LQPGDELEPFTLTISQAANDRYWEGAGVDHPLRHEHALYPLIAANLTVLTFQQRVPVAMIQTRQHRRSLRQARPPLRHCPCRDRERRRPAALDVDGRLHAGRGGRCTATMTERRELTITDDLIRVYSRRGNFHSEAVDAAALGLPGLVAQGTQVCGPAYGALLDTWGETFLAHGELDLRFVGMVLGGHTVVAAIDVDEKSAALAVENLTTNRTAATGTARRRGAAR